MKKDTFWDNCTTPLYHPFHFILDRFYFWYQRDYPDADMIDEGNRMSVLFLRMKGHLFRHKRATMQHLYFIWWNYKCAIFAIRSDMIRPRLYREDIYFSIRKMKEIARNVVKLTSFTDIPFSSWPFHPALTEILQGRRRLIGLGFWRIDRSAATITDSRLSF